MTGREILNDSIEVSEHKIYNSNNFQHNIAIAFFIYLIYFNIYWIK